MGQVTGKSHPMNRSSRPAVIAAIPLGKPPRRPGVARGHVFACTEPGRTDGPVLRLVQQRHTGEKAKESRTRRRPVHHRIRQIPGGMPEKLGQTDSEDL